MNQATSCPWCQTRWQRGHAMLNLKCIRNKSAAFPSRTAIVEPLSWPWDTEFQNDDGYLIILGRIAVAELQQLDFHLNLNGGDDVL